MGLFIAGLIALGRLTWQHVRHHDRYTAAFADIDCTPPPGQTRRDFLDEVQYLAEMPARFSLLDEDLSQRLVRAFAKHPRVERVAEVAITEARQVRIILLYRKPVLAVRWEGLLRVVDGHGILLPKETPAGGLPIFAGKPKAPQGPAGTRWGDTAIEEAARKYANDRTPREGLPSRPSSSG
jgi:hypothetical protein